MALDAVSKEYRSHVFAERDFLLRGEFALPDAANVRPIKPMAANKRGRVNFLDVIPTISFGGCCNPL